MVILSGDESKPFATTVEIHEKDSFRLIDKGNSNSSGEFSILDIEPGIYDLWVLINVKPVMISGCNDIAPPAATWKIGIKFGEDKALTIENAYLSKALALSETLQSSDLRATGFYLVMYGFVIRPGVDNTVEIVLLCK